MGNEPKPFAFWDVDARFGGSFARPTATSTRPTDRAQAICVTSRAARVESTFIRARCPSVHRVPPSPARACHPYLRSVRSMASPWSAPSDFQFAKPAGGTIISEYCCSARVFLPSCGKLHPAPQAPRPVPSQRGEAPHGFQQDRQQSASGSIAAMSTLRRQGAI